MELVEAEEVEAIEAAVQYYTAVNIYYSRRLFVVGVSFLVG